VLWLRRRHHCSDGCALAAAGVAHVVDAEVLDAVRRERKVFLEVAVEVG
jgi:hypothetical protein